MSGKQIEPPKLTDLEEYEDWAKEIQIWQALTILPPKKQGAAIYLSLEGKARQCCKSIPVEELTGDDGVTTLLNKLKELYAKDNDQLAYQAYENFETFQRTSTMTTTDFINEWDRLYEKCKAKEMALPEGVLAYRLLKSANLTTEQQTLVRATITDLKLDAMKKRIRAIFDNTLNFSESACAPIKVEPAFHAEAETEEEVLYNQSSRRGSGYNYRSRGRGSYSRGNPRGMFKDYQKSYDYNSQKKVYNQKLNPPTSSGHPSKCSICDSIMHWAKDCPHNEINKNKVVLFSNGLDETVRDSFALETFNHGVLDSGCSTTVCGKVWLDNYMSNLTSYELNETKSQTKFKFGDGRVVQSMKKVIIPIVLGNINTKIMTDVVDVNIPLLLSKESMKRANTKINFATDTVSMLGNNIELKYTNSGHYIVPLLPHQSIEVTLLGLSENETSEKDKEKIALKLHLQFGHASCDKIISLLKDSGNYDESLNSCVKKISENCEICKRYGKAKNRPVVGLSLSRDFNDCVSMDLKFLDGHIILHLIDNATRYSAAAVIPCKTKEVIIENIFKHWISIFGCPKKFLSDNGGEFNNELFRNMAELLNVEVLTTAAESPWSNGITERHNALISEMTRKVLADVNCSIHVAVAWSIAAKNALKNVYGFSPNQLVFGRNPNLPTVLESELPALEAVSSSQLIADHLNAMHAARKSFIENEASEKLRRALVKQTRTATSKIYHNGDKVFYRKRDSLRWHGPGIVIGAINKQVFVKHGGTFLRVNPCNLRLVLYRQPRNMDATKEAEDYEGNKVASTSESKEQGIHERDHTQANFESVDSDPDSSHERTSGLDIITITDIDLNSTTSTEGNDILQEAVHGKEQETVDGIEHEVHGKEQETVEVDHEIDENNSSIPLCLRRIRDFNKKGLKEQNDNIENALFSREACCKVKDLEHEAKIQEIQNLIDHEVFDEVDFKESSELIHTRWVMTDKVKEGCVTKKARLVVKGFQEDSEQIRKDSPTCLKESLRIVAAISAAHNWRLRSLDIKSAFLQGKRIERDVFVLPPPEVKSNKIWKLKKTIYGLSDASRMWYLRVKEVLREMNCSMSIYDEALFYWKDKSNQLGGILALHVDDFLVCGSVEFYEIVIQNIKSIFEISKDESDQFTYLGFQIKSNEAGIDFCQEQYIDQLTLLDTRESDMVTKELKSKIGQLAWVAGQTRPDISYDVCQLSVKDGASSDQMNVKKINKIIKRLKHNNVHINFPKMNLSKTKLICFTDASFGNLPDGASQGGYIVFLVAENGKCAPLTWQSRKLRRVVKSTLSAETMALMEGVECSILLRAIFRELIGQTNEIPIFGIIDSASLRDSLESSKTVQDKRLKIDICVLRDYLYNKEFSGVKWVPTNQQLADSLTKDGADASKLLLILRRGYLELNH